jgi:ferredoxin
MTSVETSLAETLKREFRFPDIDPDHCVHAIFNQASCHACVDSCPKSAWVLNDESLGLDTEACDGCGLCIPVCPTGALRKEFPWVIRHFGGKPLALFCCERTGMPVNNGTLPCIHALGARQLIVMHTIGINNLLIAEGDCQNCPCNSGTTLTQRVAQLNHVLASRHLAPIKLLNYSNLVWNKIYAQEEIISQGTVLKRRAFLWGNTVSDNICQQMCIFDPLNRKECQTIPPGSLLPEAESNTGDLWPWTPQLEASDCRGCDACIHLCPTGALRCEQEDSNPAYIIDAKYCNGCMICSDVCIARAIHPEPRAAVLYKRISLLEKHCTICGNPYHLPASITHVNENKCPVCQDKE